MQEGGKHGGEGVTDILASMFIMWAIWWPDRVAQNSCWAQARDLRGPIGPSNGLIGPLD